MKEKQTATHQKPGLMSGVGLPKMLLTMDMFSEVISTYPGVKTVRGQELVTQPQYSPGYLAWLLAPPRLLIDHKRQFEHF